MNCSPRQGLRTELWHNLDSIFFLLWEQGVLQAQGTCGEAFAELQLSTISPSVLCTSMTEIKMNCHVSFKRKIPQPLSIQAVTFQFMLSVYSVLALWFMINWKELDHTLFRSSRRNFCWLLEIPHAIKCTEYGCISYPSKLQPPSNEVAILIKNLLKYFYSLLFFSLRYYIWED